ncbi:MAG: hypothetical protein ACRDKY_09605 [Solirubrobacteraceae bacterium]
MTKHSTPPTRRLKPALIAGVAAVALTGGATEAAAAPSSAAAVKQTTNQVDRAWSQGKVREHTPSGRALRAAGRR